jgi:hypothetical protein
MAIEDYFKFFGGTPTMYQGLLTDPKDRAALESRANLGGLLSAAGALAQGMSPQGYRRSPIQNVLSALGAGFAGAGQTYESAINQMANVQKLQQSQGQIEALNKVLADPAIDNATKAYIRANPAEGLKLIAERSQFQKAREAYAAPVSPAVPAPTTGGEALPNIAVTGNPEIARLETSIQNALIDARVYSDQRDPVKAEAAARLADRLKERQQQLMVAETDLEPRISNAPESYKEQYRTLQSIRGTLKPDQFISAVQKIDEQVAQSRKQFKFEGLAGNFAYQMFGTNDMTQLKPEQNALVLKFANAPTEADQTKIILDAQKLKFETGAGVPIPTSREEMINRGAVPPAATTVPTSTMAGRNIDYLQALAREEGQPPAPSVSRTMPREAVAPRVTTVEPTTVSEAKQVVKDIKKPLVDATKRPLIDQPDSIVPPKLKQELLMKQPSTVALASYALKNVRDARDSAQKLLENPGYIDALTGTLSPLTVNAPGFDPYTANQLLNNLLGRAFVNELSQMRNASPTGGAVGSVAVAEMDNLSKIQAALKVGMKKDEFTKQLKQYINVSNEALKRIPQEYALTYKYGGEFDDLLRGTVVEQNAPAQTLPAGVRVRKVN